MSLFLGIVAFLAASAVVGAIGVGWISLWIWIGKHAPGESGDWISIVGAASPGLVGLTLLGGIIFSHIFNL